MQPGCPWANTPLCSLRVCLPPNRPSSWPLSAAKPWPRPLKASLRDDRRDGAGTPSPGRVLRPGTEKGVVEICNYNCPGQLVIRRTKGCRRPGSPACQGGRRPALHPLRVSGPFHTTLMAPAGQALEQRFATEPAGPMEIPVLFNCLGRENPPRTPSLLCWCARCKAAFIWRIRCAAWPSWGGPHPGGGPQQHPERFCEKDPGQ